MIESNEMKVLLVKPFDASDEVTPPISLGLLATHIRKKCKVVILDAMKERMNSAAVARVVQKENIDVVGFQMWSKDIQNVKDISRTIKSKKPTAKIIIGGYHATVLPKQTMDFFGTSIDFAYQGEGEIGFRLFLDSLMSGQHSVSLKEIPGLVWKDGSNIIVNENAYIEDLDTVGFPSWDLMPPSSYPKAPHGAFFRNFPIAPIMVTRGCPYPCTFCSARMISGSKIRSRSVGHVIEELEMLYRKFHVREFHVEDDNFTLNTEFVEHFCEALLSKGIKMTWALPNGIRLETIKRPLLKLMRKAGCYALNFGIESGSPRVLKMIKKGLSLDQIRDQIYLAHEEGFDIGGFFIIGFPTETKEEIEATIRFACSLPLDRIGVSYFQPFPGSDLFYQLVASGEIPEDWANHHHTTLHNLTYVSSSISASELQRLRKRLLCSFYVRPKPFIALLKQIQSPSHFYFIAKRSVRWLKA